VHVPEVGGSLRLVVVLHGAGGEPRRTRELLLPYAEEHRLMLLAPASRDSTWDVIQGGFGPDVATIDALLRRTAAEFVVDGITVAGFSDGASYALTLGITNGDVFDSVVAFSPGFAAAQVHNGQPRFFVSHGTGDRVLPIDRCSRRLVPELERQGYDVRYEEFDGGHEVPTAVRRRAVDWLD
jgi:predicted esterase